MRRKDGASAIVSHTKSWCHVFFLAKYISISTACKGMERNNASMLMQSEGKALLSVRQLLLNLMELQTVKICYKGDLWPSLGTLFFQLYVRGMPMLYVHTTFNETFHLHLHHRALHLRHAEMAGSAQPHTLPTWLLVHVPAALSLAEVRQEMSWLVSSHFVVVGACRLGLVESAMGKWWQIWRWGSAIWEWQISWTADVRWVYLQTEKEALLVSPRSWPPYR